MVLVTCLLFTASLVWAAFREWDRPRSFHYQLLMLVIAVVSILWATSLAFTTPDARLVVAYSSVAQLSFITLGIFALRPEGGQGALLQMLNHGLVTAPLFFLVAALAARAGGAELPRDMGG